MMRDQKNIQLTTRDKPQSHCVHGKKTNVSNIIYSLKVQVKIYTYTNFQQCNFTPKKKKNAENKSEIKPFLFKKYIYCVLSTDLVTIHLCKGKINCKSIHRTLHTIAANCIVLWLVVRVGGGMFKQSIMGIKRCYTTTRPHLSQRVCSW